MKQIPFFTIGIVILLSTTSIPVLSESMQPLSTEALLRNPMKTVSYPQSDMMKHIPFVDQEKPDFLTMNKASVGMAPTESLIVIHIKRIRLLDESIEDPEYYINVQINNEDPDYVNVDMITEKESWFQWPSFYDFVIYDEDTPLSIDIEIYLKNRFWFDTQGDIAPGPDKTLSLKYDQKRGDWSGDDYLGDPSGYGHATGYEDGNFNEHDFEFWFDIYQYEVNNDQYMDDDRLTYWEEENIYHTDPYVDDGSIDFDEDGVPSEWEDHYGYDPLTWEDHSSLDPDQDGLQNIEEWQTSVWCSQPFIQDIFIEVDFMEGKYFWSKPYTFTEDSAYLLSNAFAKKNIAMHVDLGIFGGGGDYAPYEERTVGMALEGARLKYFLNGDPTNWRRGIFHYAFICSKIEYWDREVGGRMFYVDSFVLARQTIIDNTFKYITMKFSNPTIGMASVFMHELGHTLGLSRFDGIDNIDTTKPWKPDFWNYRSYESCMNYHYTYKLIDYSDGDDAEYDQDDWSIIDLTRFERNW